MRLKINFTENTSQVPIQHQSLLNSYIHKCLGRNNKYHDSKNDYCISHIYGGKLNVKNSTLTYKDGGFIVASSTDGDFLNKILVGVLNNQELIGGMKFKGVEHLDEQFYNGWNHFSTLSPFIIKKRMDDGYKFITLNDSNFENEVENYLINKIGKIDDTLDLSDFKVTIPNNNKHKVKKILVKNVINHANQCQINIYTNKKVAKLIYNIGLGQSTGSGFGTIYKTESRNLYK